MSLFKRKDSPNWWVKITINGQTVQRSAGTDDRMKAQELHDRLKAEMWDQLRLGRKPRRSWQEAVVRWIDETNDKATHKTDLVFLKWLHPFLGDLMLDDITLQVIDSIKAAKLKEGVKKSTVNRYLEIVRAILLRARDEWEWIDHVPKVRLYREGSGRERSLTREQAERLLSELPEHQRDMVLFALATGLRQSNVYRLEWSQVNLALRHLHVPGWQSKNRRAISVPLNDLAMQVLTRMGGKHPERVFTYKGKPINAANTRAWREALKRAGIEDFRWHDLRHTWATWQRQAGTPTYELQRLGGWRTGAMVERYAHVAPDTLAEAANRLNGVLPGYDSATEIRGGGLRQG